MAYKYIADFIPKELYNIKCPYDMTPEFIVVHNTANDASAASEIANMKRTADSATSFHFAIDDAEVRQGLPLSRNGFHAGDGVNGAGNRRGIGIEICYSKSGGDKFDAAEDNAAQYIAELLKQRGWGVSHVKKHQDFSGKYCPHRTLSLGWDRFLKNIRGYMVTELTEINDIVYELHIRGIITDVDLWLDKLQTDKNAYWLARKAVQYIRREEA